MKLFAWCVFVILPVCILVFHLLTKYLLNPYKLIFVFADKGSGKTTLLAKEAVRHLNRGWHVYTTEHIPNTRQISASDIGYYEFPKHSAVFVDEASLSWDNRQFKNMKPEVIEWFRYQRHRKVKLYLFSQSFDVDKKIRDLSDHMYLLERKLRVFSYGKRINRIFDVIQAQGEGESRIVHQLEFDSLLFFWAGSRTFTYIPKYIGLFDSFESRPLEVKEFPLVPDSPYLVRDRKGKLKVKGPVTAKTRLRAFLSRFKHDDAA